MGDRTPRQRWGTCCPYDPVAVAIETQDICLLSERVDGPKHSWMFDGDDPRIVCAYCAEMRDALSGRVLRPAMPMPSGSNAPGVGT